MLREYQQRSLNDIREQFKRCKKKVFLTAPTGSGKSIIAIEIIKKTLEKNKRVAFLVDRLTLLDQFCKMVYDNGIHNFGIMQANNPLYKPYENLQIITAQTLGRRTIEPFDLVIYDEAHIIYKSITKLMNKWTETYWIGLSATPFTKGLGKLWESLVNGTSTGELIKEGFLSTYIAYGPSKPDLKGVTIQAGDYNKKMLAERTDKKQLIGDIIEHWGKIASDRQTVVGAVNVAHAEHIAETFQKNNIKADVIHCYLHDDEIKSRLNNFRDGKIKVLSSVDLISRGFDMPQVGCIIIARPTKSLNYHLQFLGRGLRVSPDVDNLIILDHAGNIERLGFPDDEFDLSLDMGLKKEQIKRKKKESLPQPCPDCHILFVGHKCPSCGYTRKKKANVETKEGQLKELQKGRHKTATPQKKERLYAQLLAGARCAGFAEGWAAHQYRSYYGVWPVKHIDFDEKFYNFLSNLPRWKMLKIIWGLTK